MTQSVAVEQPQSFVQPLRSPSFPTEAPAFPGSHQMSPHFHQFDHDENLHVVCSSALTSQYRSYSGRYKRRRSTMHDRTEGRSEHSTLFTLTVAVAVLALGGLLAPSMAAADDGAAGTADQNYHLNPLTPCAHCKLRPIRTGGSPPCAAGNSCTARGVGGTSAPAAVTKQKPIILIRHAGILRTCSRCDSIWAAAIRCSKSPPVTGPTPISNCPTEVRIS